jgi:hypothetical protein
MKSRLVEVVMGGDAKRPPRRACEVTVTEV